MPRTLPQSPRFLSTPSVRRATNASNYFSTSNKNISIHALREEGDHRIAAGNRKKHEISIHALREEGDAALSGWTGVWKDISIHALREEGDGCRNVL